MSNLVESARNLLAEARFGAGYAHPGDFPDRPTPSYRPGVHHTMSDAHHSMHISRDEHSKIMAGESGESKSVASTAHALSDKADAVKHTIANHESIAAAHKAAKDAHGKAAEHFRNMAHEHGGMRHATDGSADWRDSHTGLGGSHKVYNNETAKQYGQLATYHQNAHAYHSNKVSSATDHAPKYHSAMKTANSTQNATVKKGALTKAKFHKDQFDHTAQHKSLKDYIDHTREINSAY